MQITNKTKQYCTIRQGININMNTHTGSFLETQRFINIHMYNIFVQKQQMVICDLFTDKNLHFLVIMNYYKILF